MSSSFNRTFALGLFLMLGCAPTENALVNAARSDDLPHFQRIIAHSRLGLNQPEKGMLGYTPLIAASLSDGTNVFDFLLKAGANPNARSRDGETPLMFAMAKGDRNLFKVEKLIAAGADVNARDPQGNSVLNYARAAAAPRTVDLLRAHGAAD